MLIQIHNLNASICQTNISSQFLRLIIIILQMKSAVLFVIFFIHCVISKGPICELCHTIVEAVQKSAPQKPSQIFLDTIATQYCIRKHLQDRTVCKGAVREMMVIIVPSVWQRYTDPHMICSKLKFCSKEYIKRNLSQDITQILKNKTDKQWEQPTYKKTIRVMHISDLHTDIFYTVGAPSKCAEPVCCRSNVTKQINPWQILRQFEQGHTLKVETDNDSPAGYWGSLNSCDLPMQTFNLFLKQLDRQNVDLVIWTGDNTPHDIWQQSQSYNLNFTVMLGEKIKRHTKARVIPAMGNHESFPVNVYNYEGEREKMLIEGLAESWKQWLTIEAYQMLRTKGYFSIILPQFNNLKIISVNTQAQNNQNWFLMKDPTDPGKMLEWIKKQLEQSESKNQFVYIIGHISPKSALNDWSMRFNALTERYSYTIRGQFYGHTHTDHVGLFYSFQNRSQLVNYFLVAPSLQCGKNPEYRIMEIDFDTLQVTNYHQYMLDLRKFSRKEDDAQFQLLYSFKEAYQLDDMSVKKGMTAFGNKLKTDSETQIKYTHYQRSGLYPGKIGHEAFCDTMTSSTFVSECLGTSYKKSLFEKIAGPWKDLKH